MARIDIQKSSGLNSVKASRDLASAKAILNTEPSVYDFTDYRAFLDSFYKYKKSQNPNYSMSVFIRKAGLGLNSRGYLKMIIESKRNLAPHTLRRFIEALGLDTRASLYFENLVYFNQAKDHKDKTFYFERLSLSAEGHETESFEILKSKHHYYSNWYSVAIRELVGLHDFIEDPTWIVAQLRGRVTKKQALESLDHLLNLGLLKGNSQGKLVQSTPLVKWKGGEFDNVIQNYHFEMIKLAEEALKTDDYSDRRCSSVTLSCSRECFPEIIEKINKFRDELTQKFGTDKRAANSVIQINLQSFILTPPLRKSSSIKDTQL